MCLLLLLGSALNLLTAATLEVRLSTPTRIYLTNAKGELQAPPNSAVYKKGKEEHFSVAQTFTIDLVPGPYTLTAEKGPEYQPFTTTFTLTENQRHTVTVNVPHRIPMNARGWYSADLHNHRKLEDMPLILLTEDLNFAPALTDWIWEGRENSAPPRNLAPVQSVNPTHAFTTIDKEIERLMHGPGAIDLIGLKSIVPFDGDWLYPPNSYFAEQARKQGAYVDAEKIMWRDVPALVALGHIDFAGVVHNHFNRHNVLLETDRWGMAPKDKPEYRTNEGMALWTLDIYYRFLNCGFRLPVSAGSASGVMASPIGYNRVYAHLDKPFSVPTFLAALKQGRSFSTNGPMLFLKANKHAEPGDTIVLNAQKLTIEVAVETTGTLERIELIHNGRIIHSSPQPFTIDLTINKPGWLAARAFEKNTPSPRYAQTSPIYLTKPGLSAIYPNDARYFIEWLEREAALYRNETRFRSAAHRKAMLDFFENAIRVYRKLATERPNSTEPRASASGLRKPQ
ncbi:MAG: CehA/McbA family metallohydrolase [Acidobacteria bacterium]|nr:CehA/McbA family metallohydrolase [Acidobacteriota bacterium]